MADSTPRGASAVSRARWPYVGRPQVMLLIAGLITTVASFLAWIPTPLGDLGGGARMITFYAGVVALPGAMWRRWRVVLAHAVILAVPALILPTYDLVWALRRLPGLGAAWVPGPGLVLVWISGGVALLAAIEMLRRFSAGR